MGRDKKTDILVCSFVLAIRAKTTHTMNNEYWLYGEREQLPTEAGHCSVVTMLLCYGQPGPGPLWRDRGNVRGHRP